MFQLVMVLFCVVVVIHLLLLITCVLLIRWMTLLQMSFFTKFKEFVEFVEGALDILIGNVRVLDLSLCSGCDPLFYLVHADLTVCAHVRKVVITQLDKSEVLILFHEDD